MVGGKNFLVVQILGRKLSERTTSTQNDRSQNFSQNRIYQQLHGDGDGKRSVTLQRMSGDPSIMVAGQL